MDFVADGRTTREEAQRQLEADNLGELGQPKDRHLRSKPTFDPACRRCGDACGRAGPAEAEVPIPTSNADLAARPTDGSVGALVGAVDLALDRCHAATMDGVTYLRLNRELPGRGVILDAPARTRARPRTPAHPRSARAPARTRARPLGIAFNATPRRRSGSLRRFSHIRSKKAAVRSVRPGPCRRRWQEYRWPTQGSCRRDPWAHLS
jgi:hypothetical protein